MANKKDEEATLLALSSLEETRENGMFPLLTGLTFLLFMRIWLFSHKWQFGHRIGVVPVFAETIVEIAAYLSRKYVSITHQELKDGGPLQILPAKENSTLESHSS